MRLLVLGALIGAPIAFVAYFYLKFVNQSQIYVFTTLPHELGFSKVPAWWPIGPLLVGGLVVALALTYLPGTGGHKPAEGFKAGGGNEPINLPSIVVCSLATLCLGAVLGPEAPLIAIGGGLGVLAIHLVKKDAPPMAAVVIGGAGSFAAIATLVGSPLVAAFLLMEAVGVGGPLLGVLLVPGLLAAGIGALIFVGLDSWTGFGTFSLSVSHIPSFGITLGRRVPLGHRHRHRRRADRDGHQAGCARPAAGGGEAQDPAHPAGRVGGGAPGHPLHPGDGQARHATPCSRARTPCRH